MNDLVIETYARSLAAVAMADMAVLFGVLLVIAGAVGALTPIVPTVRAQDPAPTPVATTSLSMNRAVMTSTLTK